MPAGYLQAVVGLDTVHTLGADRYLRPTELAIRDERWLRLTPPTHPTPARFGYLRDDQHRRPDRSAASLAFDRLPSRTCRLGQRSSPTEDSRVVTAASSRVRLRLGIRRPRPPCRAESIGRAWALRAYSSRPARHRLLDAWGASLEVSRPLQHTSAASRARSEGGRPPDLSRSGVLRSLIARASEPRTLRSTNASPLRFSALPARSSRRRSIRRTRSGRVLRSRII
jgi:hypothetical protein